MDFEPDTITPPPPPSGAVHTSPPPPGRNPTTPPPVDTRRVRWTGGRIAALVIGITVVAVGGVVVVTVGFLAAANSVVDASVPTDAWIGECYERSGDLVPVPCDGRHHYEVFELIEYPLDSQRPGRLERMTGSDACEDAFEDYTGTNYWLSSLDYSIPLPNQEAWDAGVRDTVCVVHDAELSARFTSARDR